MQGGRGRTPFAATVRVVLVPGLGMILTHPLWFIVPSPPRLSCHARATENRNGRLPRLARTFFGFVRSFVRSFVARR